MQKKVTKGAAVLAVATLATGLGVGLAQAETEVVVRPADLNTVDTRATGHVDFLPYGVHVWTESNTATDKAAGYFALDVPLASITSSSMEWYGTDARPGQQIVVDADGDATTVDDRGILVGEVVYNGDWWLSNSSAQVLKDGAPSHEGGSGSENHGTLQQWSDAFPQAQALYGGFSLGSGVKGDGVIPSITYGDTVYTFSDEPAAEPVAEADVTGSYSRKQSGRTIRLDFRSAAQPANTTEGRLLTWDVKVDGVTVLHLEQGFGEREMWSTSFAKRTGKHTVTVFKNGSRVTTYTVAT